MRWLHQVNVKHLLAKAEDYESIDKSMNDVADVLSKEPCFKNFTLISKFRKIKNDEDGDYLDKANRLLGKMYDFADANSIWIG